MFKIVVGFSLPQAVRWSNGWVVPFELDQRFSVETGLVRHE